MVFWYIYIRECYDKSERRQEWKETIQQFEKATCKQTNNQTRLKRLLSWLPSSNRMTPAMVYILIFESDFKTFSSSRSEKFVQLEQPCEIRLRLRKACRTKSNAGERAPLCRPAAVILAATNAQTMRRPPKTGFARVCRCDYLHY